MATTGQVPLSDAPSDEELIAYFPGEPVTRDNADHYRGRLRRELLMNRCQQCQCWHAPAKPVCPRCWSDDVTASPVAGAGTIFLVTFLHRGPAAPGADYAAPYPVVTVELDEQPGLRFTSTVTDAEPADITIGSRVELGWCTKDRAPMPVFVLSRPQ